MTLKTVVQDACGLIPVEIPLSIVGNPDPTASLGLACTKVVAREIHRRHTWAFLAREFTFSTVVSQDKYALPSDFERFVTETAWDRTDFERIKGPLTASEWQLYKSSVLASGSQAYSRWRLKYDSSTATTRFTLHPVPGSVLSLVFEYVTANYAQSVGLVQQTAFLADTDTFLLDEYVLLLGVLQLMLRRLGFTHTEETRDYKIELEALVARDGGQGDLYLPQSLYQRRFVTTDNVPDTGFGA